MLDSTNTTETDERDSDASESAVRNSFAEREIPFDGTPKAVEYVVDEFLPAGFTVFAAAHGQGKTTVTVWLALTVCGAIQVEGLKVKIARHIVYLTEDPDQLMRLIAETVQQWNGNMDIVRECFHIFQARRDGLCEYLQLKEHINAKWHRERPHLVTKEPVTIEPLVILDTASACLSIDNENDNSEVAGAVSMLRSLFKCVVLVCHVAKNLSRKDPELITARGGGAWVADAQHEMILFEENGHRFLYADHPRKRRDAGEIREVKIDTAVRTAKALDVFGEPAVLRTRVVSDMQLSNKSARQSESSREKKRVNEAMLREVRDSVMSELKDAQRKRLKDPANLANYLSKNALETRLAVEPFTRQIVRDAMDSLIEDGKLAYVTLPKKQFNKKTTRSDYLDICSPEEENE